MLAQIFHLFLPLFLSVHKSEGSCYAKYMHIFFSGIGGVGIGPLSQIAKQLGYKVSGSDLHPSRFTDSLQAKGIDIHCGPQTEEQIAKVHKENPIDWFVYSSALPLQNPDHEELKFVDKNGIKSTKRDEFLNHILEENGTKMLAIAGTHGKTTTTAMCVWLLGQLGKIPFGYSVGGKLPFAEIASIDEGAKWFVYEADEFDRNFLAFHPGISIITGVAYDHHEVYPSEDNYNQAFVDFLSQSQNAYLWPEDIKKLGRISVGYAISSVLPGINLLGEINRRNASQAVTAVARLSGEPEQKLIDIVNEFPGVSRRFEYIDSNLVTDYAHTPEKIAGCIGLARELNKPIVVVHEPLTNRRQHYIKDEYKDLFKGVSKLYWVPSFMAREDASLEILEPSDLIEYMDNKEIAQPAMLDAQLKDSIKAHLEAGDLVVCMSGGGVNSLDDWLHQNFG